VRLTGYGGFNIPFGRAFTAVSRLADWAASCRRQREAAAVRPQWHRRQSRRRQNAFDDYIAAARWLVSRTTRRHRVASRGNSNGGLLVAVTAMQAPARSAPSAAHPPSTCCARHSASTRDCQYGLPDDPVEVRISPGIRRITTLGPTAIRDDVRAGVERPDRAAA
jgi:prolyl oligopeptidase